ncbi:adenylate/guanylate cyclase [Magnetococcus marinus MC-1]|uniref:Adenylate/guanylate cyclase n=1 Tax=Magnetococcus marinus (strain ATCC BAA-1437 / JCM 17883 / MC-1) TaxID=156889 RepID=A0L7U4_MAGMM|nr:response regulator [Magnetococcus marinus]ABK44037.1 adenylate/guanylate cyclase [Magnetococcus marinus MC-1]
MGLKVTKVLLITDTPMINKMIMGALADGERFAVEELTSDSEGFFEQIIETAPDLVFLRTELKSANGIQVCEAIKRHKMLGKRTKVVFLSGNPQIREQAIQHRADQFLTLPFQKEDVHKLMDLLVPPIPTVLYVEDSDLFHRVVVPALREEGFHVVEAWDGREALTLVDTADVDIIVTDVEMPVMDGLTLCHNVRSTMVKDIPILLLTSQTSEEAVAKGFDAGADDYLAKPVVVPELVSRIRRLLSSNAEAERPERILVVDDSELIRTTLRNALTAQGFRVDEAKDGLQGLGMSMKTHYNLVISDYEMPNLDGLEMCVRIRASENKQRANVPIIFVTTRDSKADMVKMRSIGIHAFISKPFVGDRVVAEVERVLADRRLDQQRASFRNYLSHLSQHKIVDLYDDQGGVSDDQFRTMLFMNIVGFGKICRSLDAKQLVTFLNRYFDMACEIMVRYHATVDKLINDGLYVSFDRQDDGAHRAVAAACRLVESLPKIHGETGQSFKVRIGINAGRIVLGNIGSHYRDRNFTVIGDNVELAHQAARSDQQGNLVVITDSVRKLLEDKLEVREHAVLESAGETSVPLFSVVKLKEPYSL